MGMMDAVMPKSVEELRIESSRAKAAERTRSATAASARDLEVKAPPNAADFSRTVRSASPSSPGTAMWPRATPPSAA